MSVPTYRIRDWKQHFEKAQGRKVGTVKWVAVPVKHEGLAFRRLMARDDGVMIFGVWNLMIQVAAKCRREGALETDLGPMTARDLAIVTGAPEKHFAKALEVLSSPEISWLEVVTNTGSGTGSDDTTPLPATGHNRTLQDIEEASASSCSESDKPTSEPPPEKAVLVFPCTGEGPKSWGLVPSKLAEWQEAYPAMDVLGELRKALQWLRDNPKRQKTAKGMTRYLGSWLSKAQDNGTGVLRHSGTPPPAKAASEVSVAFDFARKVIVENPPQDQERYRAAMQSLDRRTRAALKAMGGTSRIREMTEQNRGAVFAAFRAAYESAVPNLRVVAE